MKLKEILKEKPEWVESVTQETPSHEIRIKPIIKITCIGRTTPIPELEELVLDCDEITHSKITIIVSWTNYA